MPVGWLLNRIAFWLSLLLIFAIPWENILRLGSLGTASRVVGLLTAAFWFAKVLATGRLRKPLPFHGLVLLFVLWNALSVFWTIEVEDTSKSVLTYLETFVFVLILWDLYTTPADVQAALQSYVLGAYVSICVLLSNYHSGVRFSSHRFSAGDFNPNSLGFIFALGIPVAWKLALEGRNRWLKLINYGYLPLAALSILLTGSRAAALAVIPGILYIVASLGRIDRYVRGALVVAAVGLFFLLQPYVPEASIERLQGTGSEITQGDFNGRLGIWHEGLELFYRNPVVGVGSGAFSAGIESGKPPHNLPLSLLVEVGIVGFVLYGTVLAIAVSCAMGQTKWSSRFWLTILAVWFVAAAVHNFEQKKQTWLFLGLVVASYRTERSLDA